MNLTRMSTTVKEYGEPVFAKPSWRSFNLEELAAATDNFSSGTIFTPTFYFIDISGGTVVVLITLERCSNLYFWSSQECLGNENRH